MKRKALARNVLRCISIHRRSTGASNKAVRQKRLAVLPALPVSRLVATRKFYWREMMLQATLEASISKKAAEAKIKTAVARLTL